jgi:hypothetical protein
MNDEKDALIVEQALLIRELQLRTIDLTLRLSYIDSILYCIGGPLNDNKHELNREQLNIFFKIAEFSKGDE